MKTKVIKIYEPGSVDVLKIEEVEIDKPGLNEVLIEHSYAGLNFIDINQRRGTHIHSKLFLKLWGWKPPASSKK